MPQLAVKLRFGAFEFDPRTGELRKHGTRLRLQPIPARILSALLANPGDLVTRDELRDQLWPNDTFVDFEHGLNAAIGKLREALGDSATEPRFVETLPKRGYRFIASLDPAVPSSPRTAPPNPSPQPPDTLLTNAAELPHFDRPRSRFFFGGLQVMYLCFYIPAVAQLGLVEHTAAAWSQRFAPWVMLAVLISGIVGIPVRLYLLSATCFDYPRLGHKFDRLLPLLALLDLMWALSPFLLVPFIGFGLAFAATAILLWVPFAQRTLRLMIYA